MFNRIQLKTAWKSEFSYQIGVFRISRSCEIQLILPIYDLDRGQNGKQQVYTIHPDFSKAFDHVPQHLLLLKLKHYGVQGNILSVIGVFLSVRAQEVIIKGSKSSDSAPDDFDYHQYGYWSKLNLIYTSYFQSVLILA